MNSLGKCSAFSEGDASPVASLGSVSEDRHDDGRTTGSRVAWLTIAFATAICASVATVGADALWLVALGREILEQGAIPAGVPFAAAFSAEWENVPALGELVFHRLDAGLGDRGLVLAQALAVACALTLVELDMRMRRAPELSRVLVLLLVVVACIPAFVVVRAQVFSLALFPLLVLLLRSEAREPSRRIWLVVPLLALWSNLHGGALLGVAVAGAYLLFARLRREPVTAALVLAASALALCATPSLWRTPDYYLGVLGNEAARRGAGLWSPLSLAVPLDIAFVVVALVFVAFALRERPAAWEVVALAGLGVLTAQAGRNGVWLALFLAAPAAAGLGIDGGRVRVPRLARLVAAPGVAVLLSLALAREPAQAGASDVVLSRAVAVAGGSPILADALLAEQLAAEERRVWMGNPLDAFSRSDQRLYVDWLEGLPEGDRALDKAPHAVLVTVDTPAQRRLAARAGFREAARDACAVLYVRA